MEATNPSTGSAPSASSKKKIILLLGAVIVVMVIIVAAFFLGSSGSNNDTNNGTITLLKDEKKVINTQDEEIRIEYQGNGNLEFGVMINGLLDLNTTLEVFESDTWDGTYVAYLGGPEPYNVDVSLEFRVLNLTQDSITFEVRDA